jgi:hypothetical protein
VTDVAATTVQWIHRCAHAGCPNRVSVPCASCPEHASDADIVRMVAAPLFQADQVFAWFLHRPTGRA